MSEHAQRPAPHNLEAEKAVIGGLFIKPAALHDLPDDLRTDDFFLPAHREVFDALLAVVLRHRPIDLIEVTEELRARNMLQRLPGGETYLLECANGVPTAENIVHYARIVQERATLRRLIAACAEVQSSAYGDPGDVREFLAEAHAKISGVELADHEAPERIGSDIGSVLEEIEKRAVDPESYFVRTGIAAFDAKIGGLRGGQLIVVAARPGKGKSAWAKDVVSNNAAAQVPALLVSLEMEKIEVQERVLSAEARVNGRKIITGKLDMVEWTRLHTAAPKLEKWPLWLYTQNVRATRLCALIRRWYHALPVPPEGKKQKAIVAIDYLSLIEIDHEGENYARDLGKITRSLKNLAKELDVPIILLSQLNREIEKATKAREPELRDLRDSGAIEQDANMVIFPWWEGEAPKSGCKEAYLIVGKNRGGATGRCEVMWWPEYTTFRDREDSAFTTYDRTGESGRIPYADND